MAQTDTAMMRRDMLETAGTTRTALTDKTVPSFFMDRASAKYTIFETMPGANDRRFIPFNDMPLNQSKYEREQVGILDFTNLEGREKVPSLYPDPPEISPDYNANVLYYKQNLRKGAIEFQSMSSRKPNMNKTYGYSRQFYNQAKCMATVEHRPRIERNKGEDSQSISGPITISPSKTTKAADLMDSTFSGT